MRDPAALTSEELIALVENARWFAAKGRALESAEVVGVPVREGLVALAIVEVRFAAGTHEHELAHVELFGEGARVIREMDLETATPAEARDMMGLPRTGLPRPEFAPR